MLGSKTTFTVRGSLRLSQIERGEFPELAD